MALYNRGISFGSLKQYDEGIALLKQVLALGKETGDPYISSTSLVALFNLASELGDYDQAQIYLDDATAVMQEARMSWFEPYLISSRAHLAHVQGRLADAQAEVERLLPVLCNPEAGIEFSWICYEILQAAGDPRAGEILKTAYEVLIKRADMIQDEALRRSFLAIHEHQKILKTWSEIAH